MPQRLRIATFNLESLADEVTDSGPDSHHAPLVAEFELPG